MSEPSQQVAGAEATDSLLITSNFSNKTGFAWSAFFRLFNRIAREAWARDVAVVLSFARIEGEVDILDADIPHVSFEFDPLNITWAGLSRLRRQIRNNRIKFAYITDLPTWHWLYALMRLWGVQKIIVHSHISVASPFAPPRDRSIRRRIKAALHGVRLLAADEVLTCSNFVKSRLVNRAGYPASRISVLHYGLPESRFPINSPPADSQSRPLRVFCAARAVREKGIQDLIEATALLMEREDLPEFVVEYAGEGPGRKSFEVLAKQRGVESRFRFLGYLSDTTEKLREADIVAVPSVWGDAFPFSVLEAMEAGKAIVANKSGGIPEQLGVPPCGLMVRPGDVAALADAIGTLLKDDGLRKKLGGEASLRAAELFREEDYFGNVVAHVDAVFGWQQAAVLSRDSARPAKIQSGR